jgi:hypothetical protein
MIRTTYGLQQQAHILSNKLLCKQLATDGYFKLPHTLGLWKHVYRSVWFTLVVDDFGVKYVSKENAKPYMQALQKHYRVEEEWTGGLYCSIRLKRSYKQNMSTLT